MRGKQAGPALLRRWDLPLLFICALAALLIWVLPARGGEPTAVVEQDGHELYRIVLNQVEAPYTLTIEGDLPAVLLVEPGAVSFSSAACPDKLCVKTGRLQSPGQAAVCLPARITVRIEGAGREVDGYTG
jgi:hypothetical protein